MSITTLKMSQEFQKTAGFEQKQAEAIAEAIYKSREDLATKEDLERFATKEDLKKYAPKEDFERFSTKEDLKKYEPKEDSEELLSIMFEGIRAEIRKSKYITIYAALVVIFAIVVTGS